MAFFVRSAAFPSYQMGNILAEPFLPTLAVDATLPLQRMPLPYAVAEPFATEGSALAPVPPTWMYAREVAPVLAVKPVPFFPSGSPTLIAARGAAARVASYANLA